MLKEVAISTSRPEVDTSNSEPVQVLDTREFLLSLNDDISKAEKNINIRTMHAEPGHSVNLIFHNLKAASERGVNVNMQVDGYTEMVTDQKVDILPVVNQDEGDYLALLRAQQKELFKSLSEEDGSQVQVTNKAGGIGKLLLVRDLFSYWKLYLKQ